MGDLFDVNIIEECHVSPPVDSIIPPNLTLPLTYFDIPWLFYSPNQTLFFYKKRPTPKVITTLKQSLSLTLKHFYPISGNLVLPPPPTEPHIVYTKGDSVSFTIAKTNTNIDHLSGNHPRSFTNLSSLLTQLPSPSSANNDVTLVLPLLAIQVTVFSDSGLSIGLTSQHAAADERTLYAFINCWASFCKSLDINDQSFSFVFTNTPWFDRSVISDPISLKTTLLKQWWNRFPKEEEEDINNNTVQSNFYLSSSDVKTIKDHIVAKCKMVNQDPPLNLSLYETGACYTWICLLKLHLQAQNNEKTSLYLGYNASGISRLKYEIPFSYFGCCIVFGRFGALESELVGEDGLVSATRSFDVEIDRLVRDFLQGSEKWISEWNELNLRIIGSPKVDLYGIDFGFGKAHKIEKLSGDNHGRVYVMTMNGGRDIMDGGLEIGVLLPRDQINAFTSLFKDALMELDI